MRCKLLRSIKYGEGVDMIYMDNSGAISKRRIQVLQVNGDLFRAYCHMRKAKRTFKVNGILALVPVIIRERVVV